MILAASLIIFYFHVKYVVILQQLKDMIIDDPRLTKAGFVTIRIANIIWFIGIVSWWGIYFFFLQWYYVIPIIIFSFWDPIIMISPKVYFKIKNIQVSFVDKNYSSVLIYVSTVSLFSIYFFFNLLLK